MHPLLLLAVLPALACGQFYVTGGIREDSGVRPTDESVQFAVRTINQQLTASNGGRPQNLALVDIVSAQTQVVAGQLVYLTLRLTGDYECTITVWCRDYETGADRLKVTDGPTCSHVHTTGARAASTVPVPRVGGMAGSPRVEGMAGSRRVGGMAGGLISGALTLDTATSPVVARALTFAACSYNNRSNSAAFAVLGDTAGVTYTQQVTSGLTYRFYSVPVVETFCRNQGCPSATVSQRVCTPNVHGAKKTCSFTVQSQSWMKPPMTLTAMDCQ